MNKPESKIYFYIPFYPDNTTGGNKYHSQVFETLQKKGEEVNVFGNETDFNLIEKSKIRKTIYGLKIAFSIPRKSIIVLTNTAFLHFLLPVLFNIFKKHKYIIIIHHLLRDEKPKWLVCFLEKIFIKLIKNKITVSQTTKNRLLKYRMVKYDIQIIEPGLDYVPDNIYERKNVNEKLQLLYVGNIEKRKSLITVIKALKIISNFDFRFHIVGNISDKDYFNKVKDLIENMSLQDKIQFLGKVSSEDLLHYYRKSDILIFPSQWEGYGMVIAEAMANGLPVIASDIPSSKDIIEDRVNGLLFKKEDYTDLSVCIVELINDSKLYANVSHNSVKYARNFNTWESSAVKILNFIQKT